MSLILNVTSFSFDHMVLSGQNINYEEFYNENRL